MKSLKNWFIAFLLLSLLASVLPIQAQSSLPTCVTPQNPFANGFSLFTTGNAQVLGTTTHPIWVGGNMTGVSGLNVQVTNGFSDALLVSGNIGNGTTASGVVAQIPGSSARIGGNITSGSSVAGSFSTGNSSVISELADKATIIADTSANYAKLSTGGSYATSGTNLTLTKSPTNSTNLVVYYIPATVATGLQSVTFAGHDDANDIVIINITGGTTISWNGMNVDSVPNFTNSGKLLWNFTDATTINLTATTLYGAFLAPNANISFNNVILTGQVIAKTTSISSTTGFDISSYTPFVGLSTLETMSIGSYVWYDANGNGVQDDSSGIYNAHVQVLRADHACIAADGYTDGNGGYYFSMLPGDYIVLVTPPNDNYIPSPVQTAMDNDNSENDSNIASTGIFTGSYRSGIFTLSPGDEPIEDNTFYGDDWDDWLSDTNGNMTIDFGFIETVSVGSYVWLDNNSDGSQENTPLAGVTLSLMKKTTTGNFVVATDSNGTTVPNQTTGVDGLYYFDNLLSGDYKIVITPPNGLLPAPVQNGVDDNYPYDSNIAGQGSVAGSYESIVFTLMAGNEECCSGNPGDEQDDTMEYSGDMTIDFGFSPPASIGSYVWLDNNGDSYQDSSNDTPIAGAILALMMKNSSGSFVAAKHIDGTAVANETTGADGLYYFDNLPYGDYKIVVTPPNGLLPSPNQDGVDDNIPNDSNIAGQGSVAGSYESIVFTLTPGGENDYNCCYGAYTGDDQDDAAEYSGNMTIDFGFSPPASIGSYVWLDNNSDGYQDSNETPITGAILALMMKNSSGSFVSAKHIDGTGVVNQTTGADGLYYFDNLPYGDYKIVVTPPNGLLPSPTQDGVDDDIPNDSNIAGQGSVAGSYESLVFTLTPGGENDYNCCYGAYTGDDQDDAAEYSGNMTIDFGFSPPASIGSYVWLDNNSDGYQDSNETPIAGAILALMVKNSSGSFVSAKHLDGTAVANEITGADGLYYFDNLPYGDYKIVVTPNGLLPSPVQDGVDDDIPNDSNIAGQGSVAGSYESIVFTLTPGGENDYNCCYGAYTGDDQDDAAEYSGNMTIDFGFIKVYDYGDLPTSYTTVASPRHALSSDLYLGNCVDSETEGMPDVSAGTGSAGGDDHTVGLSSIGNCAVVNDDEDGISLVTPLITGKTACVSVTAMNNTGANATLQMWFDWNASGSFLADEQITFTTTGAGAIPTGGVTNREYCFTVPSGLTTLNSSTSIAYRARLSRTGGLSYTGVTDNGEVEDSIIPLICAGDYVWLDFGSAGTNHLQDANDLPISGATAILTAQNAMTYTKTTTNSGTYQFCGLPANTGPYQLAISLVGATATYTATTPNTTYDVSQAFSVSAKVGSDSSIDSDGTSASFSLGGTPADNSSFDFGYVLPLSIGSYVWEDTNVNGLQDTAETGLAGAIVSLFRKNASGSFVAAKTISGSTIVSQTTTATGLYLFTNLPSGEYKVEIIPPSVNFPSPVQTAANNDNTANDSNIAVTGVISGSYQSGVFSLRSGGGPIETGSLPGDAQDNSVDSNGNMSVDFGFIKVYDYGDLPTSYTTVDSPRHTLSSDLYLGNCVDGEAQGVPDVSAGLGSTGGDDHTVGLSSIGNCAVANDDEDGISLVTPLITGKTACVSVTAMNNTGANATLQMWFDWNASGSFLADEQITFTTTGAGAIPTGGVTNRQYCFTVPSGLTTLNSATTIAYRARLSRTGGLSYTGATDNGEVEDSIIPLICAGDYVWLDFGSAGTNHLQDANDLPISGATAILTAQNAMTYTKTTTNSGTYQFCGLPANTGPYQLAISLVGATAIYTATTPDTTYDVSQAFSVSAKVGSNSSIDSDGTSASFSLGGTPADNSSFDFGYVLPLSLGSYVWEDTNVNGLQDTAETGLAGAIVSLFRKNASGSFVAAKTISGSTIVSQTTTATGLYLFTNLPSGEYKVEIIPPVGKSPSPVQTTANNDNTANDSNIASTGVITGSYQSGVFSLQSGGGPIETGSLPGDAQDNSVDSNGNMSVDFGFRTPPPTSVTMTNAHVQDNHTILLSLTLLWIFLTTVIVWKKADDKE